MNRLWRPIQLAQSLTTALLISSGTVTVLAYAVFLNNASGNDSDNWEATAELAWATTFVSAATFAICAAAHLLITRRPPLGFGLAALGWATVLLNPLTHASFGVSPPLGLAAGLLAVGATLLQVAAAAASRRHTLTSA